jgi:hypothetical protein
MDTLGILCGMLGVNPEELKKTAEMLHGLAVSVDARLSAIEAGLARLEGHYANDARAGIAGNGRTAGEGDGDGAKGDLHRSGLAAPANAASDTGDDGAETGPAAGILGNASTGAAVARTNGAGN